MMWFKMPKGFTSQGAVQGNSYDNGGSSGNGGGSGNGFGGGGSGGNGGDGPRMTKTRAEIAAEGKYTEDIINVLDATAQYNIYSADKLNTLGKQAHQAENPNGAYIPAHLPKSYVPEGPGNSQPNDNLPLLRLHADKDNPAGRWHGSIQEAERNLGLQFNRESTNSPTSAVKTYILGYALPSDFLPGHEGREVSYFSEARVNPSIAQVQISRTLYGRQQARIDPKDVNYTNTRPIGEFFDRIKFKI